MTFRTPPSVRFLALAALLTGIAIACAGDPADPDQDEVTPDPVLILGDERTQDSVYTILTDEGINAELGPHYWEWDGTGLDSISAVILLTGYIYSETMPDSVQAALIDFVAAGGGLMTIEWLLWAVPYDYYTDVAAITPAVYNGDYDYGSETYSAALPSHAIAADLPTSFTVAYDTTWSFSYTIADTANAKQAAVVFTGSISGDAVVAGSWGDGRTVHWNMAGQYEGDAIWTPEVRQLLVNIATFISGGS